jgi:hypothetical protein
VSENRHIFVEGTLDEGLTIYFNEQHFPEANKLALKRRYTIREAYWKEANTRWVLVAVDPGYAGKLDVQSYVNRKIPLQIIAFNPDLKTFLITYADGTRMLNSVGETVVHQRRPLAPVPLQVEPPPAPAPAPGASLEEAHMLVEARQLINRLNEITKLVPNLYFTLGDDDRTITGQYEL